MSHLDVIHFVLLEIDGNWLNLHSHFAAVHTADRRSHREQAVLVQAESHFKFLLPFGLWRYASNSVRAQLVIFSRSSALTLPYFDLQSFLIIFSCFVDLGLLDGKILPCFNHDLDLV